MLRAVEAKTKDGRHVGKYMAYKCMGVTHISTHFGHSDHDYDVENKGNIR